MRAVLLSDEPQTIDYRSDDFQYAMDLGLLRQGAQGAEPANPIYREVLGRELSYNVQESLPRPRWRWLRDAAARGRVDLLVSYGGERFVVELKRVPPVHRTLERVRADGVEQLREYLGGSAVAGGSGGARWRLWLRGA